MGRSRPCRKIGYLVRPDGPQTGPTEGRGLPERSISCWECCLHRPTEYFNQVRNTLETAVDQSDEGKTPDIFRQIDLANLCRTQSSSSICHRSARWTFTCNDYSIKIDSTGLKFAVNVIMFVPLSESQAELLRLTNIGLYQKWGQQMCLAKYPTHLIFSTTKVLNNQNFKK